MHIHAPRLHSIRVAYVNSRKVDLRFWEYTVSRRFAWFGNPEPCRTERVLYVLPIIFFSFALPTPSRFGRPLTPGKGPPPSLAPGTCLRFVLRIGFNQHSPQVADFLFYFCIVVYCFLATVSRFPPPKKTQNKRVCFCASGIRST